MAAVATPQSNADLFANFSDEENDNFEVEVPSSPQLQEVSCEGTVSKWTNYLHGWQSRYLCLRDGTLSYYKSEFDTAFGCRGSVSLAKASIEVHDSDNCRFDVIVSDCCWYLRASTADERRKWCSMLELAKQSESGYGSENNLGKAVSTPSLTSQPSLQSSSSFQKASGLREKLMEMETYRDILCQQMDTLQMYFDSCAEKAGDFISAHLVTDEDDHDHDLDDLSVTPTPSNASFLRQQATAINSATNGHHNSPSFSHGIDFRGEAITFKATTQGVLQVLSHCIDMMVKREEQWKRKLGKESEKFKKLQEQFKELTEESKRKSAVLRGPDYVEGPYSKLNEEEFFDAVETALDAESENDEHVKIEADSIAPPKPTSEIMAPPKHRFVKMIDEKVKENLALVRERIDQEGTEWYLVYEDDDNMKVYRKDIEIDGLVCDPLKASHFIEGVSGREVCHYFFDKDVRLDWEVSVDKVKVIEKLSENTNIQHQWHKRIWPSSQRDTCFLSHIRQLSKEEEGERLEKQVGSSWIVTNFSVDHPDAADPRCVRATANVILLCQTVALGEVVKKKKCSRENIGCKITYMAQVNPGGWAPPSAVRQISKREYPKFLRKFSSFMQEVTKDKPLML